MRLKLLSVSLAILSLAHHSVAYVRIQLPPIDNVEVTNGSSMTIVHKTWFNSTEQTLLLYTGFNRIIHPLPGVFLNGNVQVDYSSSCQELNCEGESYDVSQWSMASGVEAEGTRCETIRVTVTGHEDVDGGMIKFHLFESDNFFNSEVIGAIRVDVVESDAELDDVTTTAMLTTALSASETTTDESDYQPQDRKESSDSSGAIVYSLAVIFLIMMVFNTITVGILVFWGINQDRIYTKNISYDSDELYRIDPQKLTNE